MSFGPIQLVVIGFDSFDGLQGDIARELDLVRGHGVIRLIDGLAVAKTAEGEIIALEESDFAADDVAEIGTAIRGLLGMETPRGGGQYEIDDRSTVGIGLTTEDVRRAAEGLKPGTGALYLLIEHSWATGLKEAVRNSGGYPLVQGFLTPEAVMMVGAELEAMLEAEAVIELAEIVKGTAILDALITVEIAEGVMDAAVQEAVDTVAVANAIRSAAAAEAVRALIMAEIIEEAAAEEAAEALVVAGLIQEAAYAIAAEAATAAGIETRELSLNAAD